MDKSDSPGIHMYRNNASKVIIARSIAGFLNTSGGDLIIGVGEDRKRNTILATWIEKEFRRLHDKDRNSDGYRRMIVDSVIQKYLTEIYDTASRHIHISFPVVSGKTLCHIYISPSEKLVFFDVGNEGALFHTDRCINPEHKRQDPDALYPPPVQIIVTWSRFPCRKAGACDLTGLKFWLDAAVT